jgi:hypothetical protein
VESSCEHGNGPSASIKDTEFLKHKDDYQFLKKASAPWNY